MLNKATFQSYNIILLLLSFIHTHTHTHMHTHTCTHTHAHTNHRLVVAMYGWYGTFDDNRYGRNRNGQLPSNAMPSAVTYIQYAGDLEENLPAAISSEFNQFDFGVDLDEPTTELPTTTEGSPDTIDPVIVGVGAGGAITALLIILIIVLVVVCGRRRQPKRKGYEITISECRHFYMGARSLSLQPVGSIILLQVPPSPPPSPSPSPSPPPFSLPYLPTHTHTPLVAEEIHTIATTHAAEADGVFTDLRPHGRAATLVYWYY